MSNAMGGLPQMVNMSSWEKKGWRYAFMTYFKTQCHIQTVWQWLPTWSLKRSFSPVTKAKGSLSCSQEPAVRFYPDPFKCSPHTVWKYLLSLLCRLKQIRHMPNTHLAVILESSRRNGNHGIIEIFCRLTFSLQTK
jgi:hypothetical protein